MTEEPKVEEIMGEAPADEAPKAGQNIADELEKLGQQLAKTAKAAWESDERKKLQTEITTGVQRFGQELSAAFEKATTSDQAKEVKTRAEKVATDVQRIDVVEEMRKGFLVGLEAINRELGKLLERLESKEGEAEAGEPAVADLAAVLTGEAPEPPAVPEPPVAPDEPQPSE